VFDNDVTIERKFFSVSEEMQTLVNKLQLVVVYSEVDESDCCISHPASHSLFSLIYCLFSVMRRSYVLNSDLLSVIKEHFLTSLQWCC